MNIAIRQVRSLLRESSDSAARESGMRFFKGGDKEAVKLYGVKSAIVRKIAKEQFAALKGLDREDVFDLCEQLWQSGYIEKIGVACEWSYAVRKRYLPADFRQFETRKKAMGKEPR